MGLLKRKGFMGVQSKLILGLTRLLRKKNLFNMSHVPLLTTLETTLEYEDTSSLLYSEANNAGSNDSGMLKSCRNGTAYKENIQTQM